MSWFVECSEEIGHYKLDKEDNDINNIKKGIDQVGLNEMK